MGHSRAGPADATSSAVKNEMELATWLDIEPTMTDALSSVPSCARLARSPLDSERARRPRYFWYGALRGANQRFKSQIIV